LPDHLRDSVDVAQRLIERGDPESAQAALEKLLAQKPNHATALYLLGVAQLRRGRGDEAEETFAKAAAARAGFTEAHVGMAEAMLQQGDAPRAVIKLREALAAGGARETLADVYRQLGRAYLALGQTEKGLRELRKALVEAPGDADAILTLAEALLADPDADPEEVRAALEKMTAVDDPPADALAELGRLELAAGHFEQAEKLLTRAVDRPSPVGLSPAARVDALAALADALLRRGNPSGANERLLMALSFSPSRADLHARLGDMHRAVGNPEAALDAYDRAVALAGPTAFLDDVRRRAVITALEAGLVPRALPHAEGRSFPAARAALALSAGNRELLGDATGDAWTAAALAELELAAGQPARAAEAALIALRLEPTHTTARRLLADARRRELGAETPATDLYALSRKIHEATAARPELADLAPAALRALEAYDRPLLVTVMGEFSSGKSTFVNAFLGAEVAPVGITPTTATINVLKYGREKAGRVVYHDDRVREIPWADVPRVLKEVDRDEAKKIRHVEVLYPVESLQRVNIVDTPGLNSIEPEHEATARQFIAQADAIVWLFTIGQAGKASERDALERIRAEGKRVLGVVNKIDQVAAGEVDTILGHLTGELSDFVEALVPVSARRALAARKSGDAEALTASHWPALDAALEARFFAQARALKRDACARRLKVILATAQERLTARAAVAQERADILGQAATRARADAAIFARGILVDERRGLLERTANAYRAAARDVLELVRPRKLPFGSHSAAAADRDYLIGFLERLLADVIAPTHTRAIEAMRAVGADAVTAARAAEDVLGPVDLHRQAAAAVTLLEAAIFDRVRAYLRGYLQGGRIDEFFNRQLAKLELTEDSVYHSLFRDAPDLEKELLAPLAEHATRAFGELASRLDRISAHAQVVRIEAEALAGAMEAHEQARQVLSGSDRPK
jgi:tetratricopeptide (TPR) repeat protein